VLKTSVDLRLTHVGEGAKARLVRHWQPNQRPRLLALSTGLVVLAVIGYPLAMLAWSSFTSAHGLSLAAWHLISTNQATTAIVHTVVVAGLATMLAVGVGIAMAILACRSDLPGRRVLGVLWAAPLLIPAYVTGLAWLGAYFRGGLSDQWVGIAWSWLEGPIGLAVLLGLQGCPLAYLLIRSVLSGQRVAELEEAARAAGASSLRTARDVMLPLLRPALVAATLLVFVMAASDFGIPAILGIPAGFSMVTTLIYAQLSFAGGQHAIASATALSSCLGVMGLVVVLALNRLSRPTGAGSRTIRGAAGAPLVTLGWARWVVFALAVAFSVATVGLPLLALVLEALSKGFTMSLSPTQWTAANLTAAVSGANLVALGRSVLLAASAAAVVAIGGGLIAVLARRGRVMGALSGLATVAFTLPGSVIAVAALLAWQHWFYGTLLIIVLAYLARFAVVGVRSADASLASLPEEQIHAAHVSGASRLRAAMDVVRPALTPGALAGFVLVFLLAVHELTISSLLYAPSTETFAVRVLNAEQGGDLALTAALAVVVTALTALVATVLLSSSRLRQLLVAGARDR
jgi:iron(III) transport system permease protein